MLRRTRRHPEKRDSNMLRYVLGAILVVAVLGVGLLWYRTENHAPVLAKIERSLSNDRLSSAIVE